MPSYELTYILRPQEEADLNAVIDRVATVVTSNGGEITARNDWGKRHLAFPIRKLNEGYYVALQLKLPPQAVRPIERALQLHDEVLRYLIIRAESAEQPAAAPAAPAERS